MIQIVLPVDVPKTEYCGEDDKALGENQIAEGEAEEAKIIERLEKIYGEN